MLKVVYYTAEWCKPCQSFRPVVERVSSEMGFEVEYRDISSIEDDHIRIMGIPTLVFYLDGKQVYSLAGAYPEEKFRTYVRTVLRGTR